MFSLLAAILCVQNVQSKNQALKVLLKEKCIQESEDESQWDWGKKVLRP